MGTVFAVEVDDEHDHADIEPVFDWWRQVDERFSTFRDDSEISRLRRGELSLDDAHPDIRHVLTICGDLEHLTDGHFGIGAGTALDPAGYVKGWSVDEAALMLRTVGIDDAMLYAGGDVLCVGSPPDGDRWQVGVRDPFDPDAVAFSLEVEWGAVATSGTYERGDHIRGAGTGAPASVTVVGPALGMADALATAIFAAGVDAAEWLERFDGYGAVVVSSSGAVLVLGSPAAVMDG